MERIETPKVTNILPEYRRRRILLVIHLVTYNVFVNTLFLNYFHKVLFPYSNALRFSSSSVRGTIVPQYALSLRNILLIENFVS
jgi:hypothetical protein